MKEGSFSDEYSDDEEGGGGKGKKGKGGEEGSYYSEDVSDSDYS